MVAHCYVCNKSSSNDLLKSLVELKAQYSNKFCIEIINEILGDAISRRQIYDESDCICVICFNLIEDYDLHSLSVELRKKRLREMLVRTLLLHNKNVTMKRTAEKIITNGSETSPSPEKIRKLAGLSDNSKVILNKLKPIRYVKLCVTQPKSQIQQTLPANDVKKVAHNSQLKVVPSGQLKIAPNGQLIIVPNGELKIAPNGPLAASSSQLKIASNGQLKIVPNDQLKVAPNRPLKAVPTMPRRVRVKDVIGVNCEKCDETFQHDKIGKRKLKAHMQWHEKHPGFQCFVCYFQLSDKESLIDHLKLHKGRPKSECVICGRDYQACLKNHVQQVHGEKNKLCDFCGMVFTSDNALMGHQKRHTKEFKGECDICGHIVYTRKNLVSHLRNHSNVRPHTCSVCGMQFKRPDTLRTHERRHNEDTKTLKCTLCPSAFEHKFYLKQHMQKKHQIEYLGEKSSHGLG